MLRYTYISYLVRFSSGVAEVSVLLGYDAASLGNWFPYVSGQCSDLATCLLNHQSR
jgi:hypothetical protein